LGDIGNDAILGLVNSFLMIYYTNVLGIAGGVVGILFLVSRCIDAFSDLAVGRMIDVAELTPKGRFLPWINRMKWPFCAFSLLLFAPFVSSWGLTAKIAYVFVSYLVCVILLLCIIITFCSIYFYIIDDLVVIIFILIFIDFLYVVCFSV